MIALKLTGVTKSRGTGRHRVRAITDVDLEVDCGELVLVQGPSGSGKTTLLAVAGGLLSADQGNVRLAGVNIGKQTPAEARRVRARLVGFVFQRANLLPQITVAENVIVQADLAGLDRRDARKEAWALLSDLGIAHLAKRRPAELSGGEEQRAAVARALVHGPAVVLADEPTASLDSASGRAVAEQLQRLAAERDTAVVAATHDPRLARYGSRIVFLEDGQRVESTT